MHLIRISIFLAATALCQPQTRAADLTPHDADYRITLGTAVNAPQVGTVRQRLAEGCRNWHLQRDIAVSFSITATWRYDIRSLLRADQSGNGTRMDYKLERTNNGDREERSGVVAPSPTATGQADLKSRAGPQKLGLPPGTLLPAAALRAVIDRLSGGDRQFVLNLWDSEIISDVFRVTVSVLDDDAMARGRPPPGAAELFAGRAWPLAFSFRRARDGDDVAPLFSLTMLLYDSGAIGRLTVPLNFITLVVEPTRFQVLPRTRC